MIGTTGATVLFSINVLLACVLGTGTGALACLALGQPWGLKEALIDCLLAAVVAVVAAYVIAMIEISRGVWESRIALILAIAVVSVVARHFIRFKFHSAN